MDRKQKNRKTARRLVLVAVGMFGFGFALWPLYNVLCEVTGQRIPLEELRYWSVERQEAYVSASAVDKRRQQLESGENS